ncbi:hypothetical protein HRD49_13775 [Corallococcus exiguus]|uniref:Lipoprotein n=1 Tax=Corallococcus exiguus TaxID=83462 RepID=A0A7X5BQD0_9BACT|nr:hypothetical protein [Corallococcus exiguus]NBC41836.1 hypothetical protein [Corallococcus exiguus]NNC21198.1 hypothetical protein [Corallococcus exiguus]NRD62817.1 hypothetical protein [Corallococcus exiguus]TNV61733.1 hypothetical protein FH620_20300 [Corallococcus exiguus]
MKKLLLGLMLAAVPLVGCGTGVEDYPSDNAEMISTESGQSIILDHNPMTSSDEPLASMESPSEVSAMGPNCWVTLLYCKWPGTDIGVCKDNGKCTAAQLRNNCIALYNKTC